MEISIWLVTTEASLIEAFCGFYGRICYVTLEMEGPLYLRIKLFIWHELRTVKCSFQNKMKPHPVWKYTIYIQYILSNRIVLYNNIWPRLFAISEWKTNLIILTCNIFIRYVWYRVFKFNSAQFCWWKGRIMI